MDLICLIFMVVRCVGIADRDPHNGLLVSSLVPEFRSSGSKVPDSVWPKLMVITKNFIHTAV